MAISVGVLFSKTIKIHFVSGFLDIELLNDESMSLVSTNWQCKISSGIIPPSKNRPTYIHFDMGTKLCISSNHVSLVQLFVTLSQQNATLSVIHYTQYPHSFYAMMLLQIRFIKIMFHGLLSRKWPAQNLCYARSHRCHTLLFSNS